MQPVLPAYLIARWLLLLVLLAGVYFLSGFLVPALAALIIGLASWPLCQRITTEKQLCLTCRWKSYANVS